jgi:hypothetical protein
MSTTGLRILIWILLFYSVAFKMPTFAYSLQYCRHTVFTSVYKDKIFRNFEAITSMTNSLVRPILPNKARQLFTANLSRPHIFLPAPFELCGRIFGQLATATMTYLVLDGSVEAAFLL